ncbi:NADH-quinone oxidoreductase subunit A [Enterobacteriaceae endosymbiont of Donacia bicoloricornis]|uniref:NADH-quinone oxidoreductase subunit A n=1 Tax=Enterobacteriaceae endosymbiont of Donacia bicoloricornis TaxID=2675772 RepID=UPI001448C641|nr:NADH-quinone oxidoreductase subunit A [Enterobacteriaceae endosymbiont of Donacia bicoloricornis]QJC37882.1 NADH-quinone oxidoreductase subunit A [Enterobacteriaceae endosymbiont of Donacia bicoloricornis]
MINTLTYNPQYFILFQISAITISCLVMLLSFFLGGYSYGIDKEIPFESGVCSYDISQKKIHINFYLIAIFFIIFDIESLYLYLWSITIKIIKLESFIEGILFILTILITLFYLFKMKALNWKYKKN